MRAAHFDLYVVSAFRRTSHGPAKAGHYVQLEKALGVGERLLARLAETISPRLFFQNSRRTTAQGDDNRDRNRGVFHGADFLNACYLRLFSSALENLFLQGFEKAVPGLLVG